ncbi:hypothetical protein S7711_07013 [Stachybotrys chartarum IBT 7711]|uniref:Uncharacterized protein n=1 Tax=Stachybotrys chartarum (strain CBS 109288 / IBT 7711) TaxID=1280523 RepID=A0A084AYD8_STACB|nr:hypothetical protein S7711_07013 [Stachybotrys chartarum IBT 7711]KFA48236.1 hypothetical protein S40293_09572 [Stachybotrys chartarum IBT 40293]
MASTDQLFSALLRSEHIRHNLLPLLSTADLCALRGASSSCCNLVTKHAFTRIHVSFNASTFTRASRVAALGRVGHHVEHLTFSFPHSAATFLPPLVHPQTGAEIAFLYTPHTSMGSVLTRPKYANTELGDILTQQYPPLFHAATNVPSFIHAMKMLPNVRHLTVRCPGQSPTERYRRDAVDYALISLRISVERAPMDKLHKLSLSGLHPAAFNYLRHQGGFGTVPSAGKRWRQIRKLHISVDAWDFYGPNPGLDHLKVMDDYIRTFSPQLEKFTFAWLGGKGPCPIALSADPLFAPPRSTKKLFHEVTSPMSPLPLRPARNPIHFPKLRYLQIRNATMNAPQLKELICSHQATVKEYDFENVVLINNGNWEDALAPLNSDDLWSRSSLTAASECSLLTAESVDDLPTPSAAVEAASKELLEYDLGGYTLADDYFGRVDDDVPAEELPIPKEAAVVSFTTKLKKRRRRRKHRKDEDEEPSKPPISLFNRHKPSRPFLKASVESEILRPPTPMPKPPVAPIISAPILNPDRHPVLLQPTVYDPSAPRTPDDGISAVQRNIEQEEAHRLLAEDAAARVSALQKAKAAVLMKLSREFCNTKAKANDAVTACRFMASREFLGCGRDVVEDRRGLESQSLLVPLMFSRS